MSDPCYCVRAPVDDCPTHGTQDAKTLPNTNARTFTGEAVYYSRQHEGSEVEGRTSFDIASLILYVRSVLLDRCP